MANRGDYKIEPLHPTCNIPEIPSKVNELVDAVNFLFTMHPKLAAEFADIPVQRLHGQGNRGPESIPEISKER